ncbi:hypothetical protein Gorai_014653, partial [Gossypium raimondii]|nr:hypothetical protein [Gossypium raimondii]
MGYGAIVRDSDCFVLGRSKSFKETAIDVEWAELISFEENVKVVGDLNISKVVFEFEVPIWSTGLKREVGTLLSWCN